MLTVAIAASLASLLAGGAALPPPGPPAVIRIPEEPDAIVLPHAEPTLQAVAADLNADGAVELVRLVGRNDEPLWIEAWREGPDGWELAARPTIAVDGAGGQAELAYARRPVRLLVRRVDGVDRVTLLRQPNFSEPEEPEQCCLLLDDLVLAGPALHLERVADPGSIADAVHVIDLDGDGTDELVATYSLDPLNDAGTSTVGRVHRWTGERFAPPTVTELPVGSGSTPFVLGDSDGLPGDEIAFISVSAFNALFRVSLGKEDSLLVERSGLFVGAAVAVPLGGRRRGIAAMEPSIGGIAVHSWPRGGPAREATAAVPVVDSRLIGVVEIGGTPRLLALPYDYPALHVLALPDLAPLPMGPVGPSEAAAALADGAVLPYAGMLPGGGPNGETAAIVRGRLLPAPILDRPAALTGALAGGQPVGLVGHDRSWLAVQQTALGPEIDPRGGRLVPPAFDPDATVTLAPFALVVAPEGSGGTYTPTIDRAAELRDGVTGVSRDGLVALVEAPRGSRVYVTSQDLTLLAEVSLVGESDSVEVAVDPPDDLVSTPGQVTMTVVTPAGHSYRTSWMLRVIEDAPDLTVTTETPFGSSGVTIAGRTAPYATVTVAGSPVPVDEDGAFSAAVDLPPWPTAVTIAADDPIGNGSTAVVYGVGLFDYRALPWIPIAVVLLGTVAVALLRRVPQPRAGPRSIADDAVLEDLDPTDRL
jgi:hypothetical protein